MKQLTEEYKEKEQKRLAEEANTKMMEELKAQIDSIQQRREEQDNELEELRHERAKENAIKQLQENQPLIEKSDDVIALEKFLKEQQKELENSEKQRRDYFGSPVGKKEHKEATSTTTHVTEHSAVATATATTSTVPNLQLPEDVLDGLRTLGKLDKQGLPLDAALTKLVGNTSTRPKPNIDSSPKNSNANVLISPPRRSSSIGSPRSSKMLGMGDLSLFINQQSSSKKKKNKPISTSTPKTPKSKNSPASRTLFIETGGDVSPTTAEYRKLASNRIMAIQILTKNLSTPLVNDKGLKSIEALCEKYEIECVGDLYKLKDSFFWILLQYLSEENSAKPDSQNRLRRKLVSYIGMNELNFTRVCSNTQHSTLN